MAIVKFGPTVVGARGVIAGTIFSANRGGPYARAWSRGSNPRSTLQTSQRGILGRLAASWAGLTQPQRDDWIDYADDPPQELTNSLGETYFASGFNWFIHINQDLEAAGEATRVDAPTLVRPPAPIFATGPTDTRLLTSDSSIETRARFTVGSPNLAFNHVIAARIVTQGRTAIAAGFVFMLVDIPNVSRVIDFQPEIESAFGTIALLQRMFVTARSQDSQGQRSPLDQLFVDSEFVP